MRYALLFVLNAMCLLVLVGLFAAESSTTLLADEPEIIHVDNIVDNGVVEESIRWSLAEVPEDGHYRLLYVQLGFIGIFLAILLFMYIALRMEPINYQAKEIRPAFCVLRGMAYLADLFIWYLSFALIWYLILLFKWAVVHPYYMDHPYSFNLTAMYAEETMLGVVILSISALQDAVGYRSTGKKLARIELVRFDGRPASWGMAMLRYVLPILLHPLVVIDIFMMLFSKSHYSLTDRMTKTVVIYQPKDNNENDVVVNTIQEA